MASEEDQLLGHALRDLVTRLQRRLRKQVNIPEQLSVAEQGVIYILLGTDEVLPSELCAQTNISSQFMSQVLKRLESLDYVSRTPSSTDGRKTLVSMTKNGRKKIEKLRKEKDEWLTEAIVQQFTAKEKETIKKAIDLLGGIIDQ